MSSARIRYAKLAGPTDKEVVAAKMVLTQREEAVKDRKASARVQCAAYGASPCSPIAKPCGKWFPVAEAVFIDEQHWREPYGCTGGGYWYSDEGYFVCPHCGYLNRPYGRDEVGKLREYFKRSVTAYSGYSGFSSTLNFERGQEYPYPPHVKARIELERAQEEIRRAEARVKHLKRKAA